MSDQRIPKIVLFGWFMKTHPRCGLKRRWRDMTATNINVGTWYDTALNRGEWLNNVLRELLIINLPTTRNRDL